MNNSVSITYRYSTYVPASILIKTIKSPPILFNIVSAQIPIIMKTSALLLLLPITAKAFAPNAQPTIVTSLSGSSSSPDTEIISRRNAMGGIATIFLSTIATTNVNALDMDAFMNAELASDLKNCDPKKDPKCVPKLTEDEALCKYGQGGKARGAACQRIRDQGKEVPKAAPGGKSLGGAYAM
jgi:hypothetical protein